MGYRDQKALSYYLFQGIIDMAIYSFDERPFPIILSGVEG